ncbi:MAG: hypothetical protein RQ826_09355, partial [Xanthomonadales bacterium]|nr:hypothetical protein [Xanthomonadales bacterium]
RRPYFFENHEVDMLVSMLMAVAGELAVTRDRLDTLERLIEKHGVLDRDEIESFAPDEDVQAQREVWREEYLERILRIIHHELQSRESGESDEGYERFVEEVTRS